MMGPRGEVSVTASRWRDETGVVGWGWGLGRGCQWSRSGCGGMYLPPTISGTVGGGFGHDLII